MQQLLKLSLIFLAIAVLPACGPHYQKRSLSYLKHDNPNYTHTQNNVTLEVRKLNKSQTRELFDGQGKYLPRLKTLPLHVQIINQSNITQVIDKNSIALPQCDELIVQNALRKNNLPFVGAVFIGLAPVCLCFIATATIGLAASALALDLASNLSNSFILSPLFWTSATLISVGGACCFTYKKREKYNQDLCKDLAEKSIYESLDCTPGTTLEFFFFADAKQFKNNFDVTLVEKITNTPLTFNVTL